MIQTTEANDPDVRELYGRTSEKRLFRVHSQTQSNPIDAVERRCQFGSRHPWDTEMRVQRIKITEALSPTAWRVQVDYGRTPDVLRDIERPRRKNWTYEQGWHPVPDRPWPTIWWYTWRFAAMLAWAGGVWAVAEWTK